MNKMVVTNKFELEMLGETVFDGSTVKMGIYNFPSMREFIERFSLLNNEVIIEFRVRNDSYRTDHERYYYQKVLKELFGNSWQVTAFNYLESFKKGDCLVAINISHDPIYTDSEMSLQDTTSIYLLEF